MQHYELECVVLVVKYQNTPLRLGWIAHHFLTRGTNKASFILVSHFRTNHNMDPPRYLYIWGFYV